MRTERALAGLIGAVLVLALLAAPARADAAPSDRGVKRTCGLLPGDGYYNFIKTTNVSCREGNRVASKAYRKFCAPNFQGCDVGVNDTDKGRVRVDGWRCKIKLGYESSQQRCKKGRMRFIKKSGA